MHADQNMEVWARLLGGKSLEGLDLPVRNGRIALAGIFPWQPSVEKKIRTPLADVSQLGDLLVIKHVNWKSLDFSGTRLNSLRFFDCTIDDCVFDNCICQGWRLWGTTIINSRFCSTDFRTSALGGIQEGRINTFKNLEFNDVDLRETVYVSAKFLDCAFKKSRLNKVNFQGSSFINCTFEGELREVCFNRKAFGAETLPANEMLRVDFSRAQLRFVEFRELDLVDVSFPTDASHIVVNNYSQTLDALLETLGTGKDIASRKLTAYLSIHRKWAGAKQKRGILNKQDLLEIGGGDGPRLVQEIIESATR